jgi:hypothetical protein
MHTETHYPATTPAGVKRALESARHSGDRVRIWLGNAETGEAWVEEWDVLGRVGQSTGPTRVPLLIHSARSCGGGAISTDCVVAVRRTIDRVWLYRHPTFNPGAFTLRDATGAAIVAQGYTHETLDATGAVHARFKSETAARRWLAFMAGERFAR